MTDDSTHDGDTRAVTREPPGLIVGVGASAGGIDACKRLLGAVPAGEGLALVIVLHLAPSQESHLAHIFSSATGMSVTQVAGTQRLEPNQVYVIAPASSLTLSDGVLQVGDAEEPHYRARPIDRFFSSLAADQHASAVGIVLSGTGDDGSAGLAAIHAAGGLCLVQDPDTAEYDGMPRSAIDTGAADAVIRPEDMGDVLRKFAATPHVRPSSEESKRSEPTEPGEGLGSILWLLEQRYGLDFRNYKTGTLRRRTERRMGFKRITSSSDYLEYLRVNPEEVEALYRDLLIGVTSFFRDPEEWEFLEQRVVPELLEQHGQDEPIRVWSAGCATGEEAYGLAIVFLEHLERTGQLLKLRVFASDVSREALQVARQGLYPFDIEESMAPERLRRFFRRTEKGFQVNRTLRDSVTFAAHDLLSDPPFAHLDLVSCRNVLIYLEPHAQERLLDGFHFALRPRGMVWLGSSETVGRRNELFEAVSSTHRFYRSTAQSERRRAAGWTASRSPGFKVRSPAAPPAGSKVGRLLEQLVLERFTPACVIVDRSFEILYFFGLTDDYLRRPGGEVRMDVLSWVRPGLYAKLRASLTEAVEQQRRVTVTAVRIEPDTTAAYVNIIIEPITSIREAEGLFAVVFRGMPKPSELEEAPADVAVADHAIVAQLEQELEDTRQELHATVDQLKTTNEEHHASHEELLSLNEEFQSSNEELETSKEELQSLNEELTTINRQLEERNDELRSLNGDLNNLLVSTDVPTVFLDGDLNVRRFTPSCTEVMRIVRTDLGRSLESIKMRVRDERILVDARHAMETGAPVEAEVSTDDERWFMRRALPYRSEDGSIDGACLTFQEVTAQKRASLESEHARLYAETIIRTSRTPLVVLDETLRIVSANSAFRDIFKVDEEVEGCRIYELSAGAWDISPLRSLLEERLPKEREIRNYDIEHTFEQLGWRAMRVNANVMVLEGLPRLQLLSIEDVTDLRRAERTAQKRSEELLQEHRRKDEFLAMLGHELRHPLAALVNGLEVQGMTKDPAQIEQVRSMMLRQMQRMRSVLDQLLEVGRVISGKFELAQDAVDLADACRSAIETLKPLLDSSGQELTVSLPPEGAAVVLGDAIRLAQIVENLLGNAVKYTPSGGRIWLTVEATDETVKLSVRDTGMGMDSDLIEHAFDLFTQAPGHLDRAKGGLGVGLALVRTLVEMQRGRVAAHSEGRGKGSEFVVTLPRLRTARVASSTEDKAASLSSVPPRRVLVVDDQEDAADLLVHILRIKGHEARSAHDGAGALEAAREFHPDVVLLDLGLPGMNGYAVAEQLRKEHLDPMQLIALTGYPKDMKRLQAVGFDEHLLKPVDLDRLAALLANVAPSPDATEISPS